MFLVFFLIAFQAYSSCVSIECQDTFDPSFRCIEVTETVKVAACPPGMYCPSYSDVANYNQSLTFLDTYCEYLPYNMPIDLCTDPTYQGTQLPGDPCCANSNCNTNMCSNLKCQGLIIGDPCSTNSECGPGLYCGTNSTCVEALPEGSKCTSDNECMIGYGCNSKYCTELWSIGFSEKAQYAKFCVSNYLFGGYCDMIQVKLNGTSLISSPFKCNLEDTCSYYSASFRLVMDETPCLCSGDLNSTSGYCGGYINQVEGMFESTFKNLKYDTSICSGPKAHTSDPYDLWQCESISSLTYQNFILEQKRNDFWVLYNSKVLDKCAETLTLFQVSSSRFFSLIFAGFLFYS